MSVPQSREVTEETFWRSGAGFRWARPKLTVGQPADRKLRAGLNRYPHNVIGAYIVAFGRYFGVTWKRS